MTSRSSLQLILKLGVAAMAFAAVAGCQEDVPKHLSLAEGCVLDTATAEACDDCLEFDHEARLGTVDGLGYLEARGGIEAVRRDHRGNYWVGQGEKINVYEPDGDFLTTVGREGEGPMEFQYARPLHVDTRGQVHIWDISNMRLSVVDEEFALSREQPLPPLPSINSIAPLSDGSRYVIQAWIQTPDRIGLPLHVIDGKDILASFGATVKEGGVTVESRYTTRRHLTTDNADNIYAAHVADYVIEVWSPGGSLVGTLEGIPPLDDGLRGSAREAPSDKHPPWNELVDLHVDEKGLLWVLLRHRRDDWRENSVEMAYSDGEIVIAPIDEIPSNWYRSRVDVIDVKGCVRIASQWHDEFFVGFVSDGFMAAGQLSPAGVPFIDVFRATMRK